MLTYEDLLRQVHYCPETGVFTRLTGRNAGTTVTVRPGQYGQLWLKFGDNERQIFLLHRLAWFYMTGEWPKNSVDHINGKRDDTRWVNLRDVTHRTNILNRQGANSNNILGVRGVCQHDERFKAQFWNGETTIHLGMFDTVEEASDAWQEAHSARGVV